MRGDTCRNSEEERGLVKEGNVSCVGRGKGKGRMGEGGVPSGSYRKAARRLRASAIVNDKV